LSDDERARLFVALDLPAAARDALLGWRSDALADVPGLRLLAPEALHMTLCFLGWRWVSEIDDIAGSTCDVARGASVSGLELAEPIWLPPRRPRALGVQVLDHDGSLGRLQAAQSDALQAGGWYVPEARPFLPHVTVARVVKGARVRAVSLPGPPATALVPGAAVTLYRSRLGAGGARYEPLSTIPVGSGGGGARSGGAG
jgi:2'-5' RNA ligase